MLETVITETHAPVTASVIWLHGLGADGYDFADIVPQLQLPSTLGVRFIFPHAPLRPVTINNGLTMRAWYDIHSLNDLNREDRAGITASQQAVEKLIEQQKQAGIPASRIVLAGFSQGGAIALHTGLRCKEKLAGILGLSTYLPCASEFIASQHPVNQKTSIFLAHGTDDNILPVSLGEKTRDILLQSGYNIHWHSYPMAHQVCPLEIQDMQKWLIFILKKE